MPPASKDPYYLLGQRIVSEVMGADGFNAQFGVNLLSDLVKRGVATYDDKANVQKAIAADVAWANAIRTSLLETGSVSRDPQRILAAKTLEESAAKDADGISLTPDGMAKRIVAAQNTARVASQASLSDPGNPAKAAAMKAWQQVLAHAQGQGSGGNYGSDAAAMTLYRPPSAGTNFLTKMAGPLPVWGWGLVGVGTLVSLYALSKALHGKKRR